MTVRYEFDRGPFGKLAAQVGAIADRAKAPNPALQSAARELKAAIRQAITQQRGMNNERWAPKKGGGKAIQGVAEDVFVEVDGTKIVFGVRGAGVYHQFGSSRLPRRPFLPTDASGTPLFESGAAKAWLDQTGEKLLAYVLRNER